MIGLWRIEGHAIVSADDRIADADGNTPAELRNDADWARFQAALGAAAVVALGRLGHLAHPNRNRRNRLVLSSDATGIERREDGWWLNPAAVSLADALARAAPGGGIVAVPGGRRVFDYFLAAGFDAFHLACNPGITIPAGVPLFSGLGPGRSAADALATAGLVAGPAEILDPDAGVTLTTWRRTAT